MRVVNICLPLLGGIYSVFLTMRRGLAPHGVEVTWVAAGKTADDMCRSAAMPEDAAIGDLIAPDASRDLDLAHAYLGYLESRADLVVINVVGGTVEPNLARYLPARIPRILIVHNITLGTYRAARAIRDWVHVTVGVAPRIVRDLIEEWGFDPAFTHLIPNAIPAAGFPALPKSPNLDQPLRILSHGRVEHSSKGVRWIPEILDRTRKAGVRFTATISGDGPDAPALRHEIGHRHLADVVRFTGWTPREQVHGLMASHDVFLFASIYEGFGITLAEAMAAGCVPVASRIHGVTDWLVDHGRSGLLFPIGDTRAATMHLLQLDRDRGMLTQLSAQARSAALARFTEETQGAAYHQLFREVVASPRPIAAPLSLSQWSLPRGLRSAWWHSLPEPAKDVLRMARERIHAARA
ncbi:MAG: glycosyltransferase family 4 protein [Bryobacteraceae bacterium]|jgi:glycosyltransferase involved in cell wall biosynthesis